MSSEAVIAHPAGISKMIFAVSLIVVAVAAGAGGYFGYQYSHPTSPNTTQSTITLNGAGATFPYPFLSAVIANYTKTSHNNATLQVNYNPVGSGAGVTALSQKNVDFAGSDYPLSSTDRQNAPNALEIPETIGAVVVAYNLNGISSGLHLDAVTIAKIMQGDITMWNDTAIQNLNPSITLPKHGIITVHRSDGSGTTFIFTTWLNTTATGVWRLKAGKTVTWPSGFAEMGNQGVASTIQQNQYTIGYVEFAYALTNKMAMTYVQNPMATFVEPSLTNATYAVTNATASKTLPSGDQSWTGVSLLNAPGPNSYPIVGFTYLMVYKELKGNTPDLNQNNANALTDFLWFVVHGGQAQAASLGYVPLPQSVVSIDETTIRSVTFNGSTLHS